LLGSKKGKPVFAFLTLLVVQMVDIALLFNDGARLVIRQSSNGSATFLNYQIAQRLIAVLFKIFL